MKTLSRISESKMDSFEQFIVSKSDSEAVLGGRTVTIVQCTKYVDNNNGEITKLKVKDRYCD